MKETLTYLGLQFIPFGGMMYFMLTGRKRKPWVTISLCVLMVWLIWVSGAAYIWYLIKNNHH